MGLLLEGQVKFLKDYGYLTSGDAEQVKSFDDIQYRSAIERFRRFDANVERIESVTGDEDSTTSVAMLMPRCSVMDIDIGAEAAIGKGGWAGCITPGLHGSIVEVNQSGLPDFLEDDFRQVLANTQSAYAEIGLLFIFRDKHTKEDLIVGGTVTGEAQTVLTFERGQGWIGLALVGPFSCGSRAWLKLDPGYRPSSVISEWTTLLKHELGHNCGLRHSSGGVMNPSIVRGLPISWAGDPQAGNLRRMFSGVPIEIPGGNPEPPSGDDGIWPPPFNPIGDSFQLAPGVRAQLYRVLGG